MRSAGKVRNVVILCADTYRRDFMSLYRHKPQIVDEGKLETNLSRLIESGKINAFAYKKHYPLSYPTVPHRRDILEGRAHFKHGHFLSIEEDSITLPEKLQDAQVVSQLITDNMHFNTFNLNKGFLGSVWVRGQAKDKLNSYPRDVELTFEPIKYKWKGFSIKQKYRNSLLLDMKHPFHKEVLDQSYHWLRSYLSADSAPLFLWIDLYDPHEPWVDFSRRRENMFGLLDPAYTDTDFFNSAELMEIRESYARTHRDVSNSIASFLSDLNDMNFFEHSLLIFISDHGYLLGEHGKIGKHPSRFTRENGLPDENRWGLFREQISIPMILVFPDSFDTDRMTWDGIIQPHDLHKIIVDILVKQARLEDIFCGPFNGADKSIVVLSANPRIDYNKFGYTLIEKSGDLHTVTFGEQCETAKIFDIQKDPYQLKGEEISGEALEEVHRTFESITKQLA